MEVWLCPNKRTHPCHEFISGLDNLPLKLGHRWYVTHKTMSITDFSYVKYPVVIYNNGIRVLWVGGRFGECGNVCVGVLIVSAHDDVIKCKHFPLYWPFVRGIHRSPVNCPHKGQWRGALMYSLICAWINGWVNNGEAVDLRRHRAHYDVTVVHWILTYCMDKSIYLPKLIQHVKVGYCYVDLTVTWIDRFDSQFAGWKKRRFS